MYWQLAKYGIPVALAVAFVVHYTGLRSERAELRESVAQMSQDIAGLKEQALEDAGRITALAASRDELDRLYQDQKAQSERDLQRVQTGMRNLRNALDTLKTQPVSDGTVGPDVTALLYEQRDAAAADLAARARRLGSSGSGNLQAEPKPAGSASDAAPEPAGDDGPVRPDAEPVSRMERGNDELGEAGVEPDAGLAGSMAETEGLLATADDGLGKRTNGQILQDMVDARLIEAGYFQAPTQDDTQVSVWPITCIRSVELDKVVTAVQADGSVIEHVIPRSPDAGRGTVTIVGDVILTADHVVEKGCETILIDNRLWVGEITHWPELDVARLGGGSLSACAAYREGDPIETKAVRSVASNGATEFALFTYMTGEGVSIPLPKYGRSDKLPDVSQAIKLDRAPVFGNSGGAAIYGDGEPAGIVTASTPDENLGWVTPMSEICKAMAER